MTPAYASPARASWTIAVLTLLGFVLSADITLTALLLEPMKRELHLTDVSAALVQGTAYGLALGAGSVPMGRLIDRASRRLLIAGGLLAWAAALATVGLARGVGPLIAGRAVLGLVAALLVPAGFSMAADVHPPDRRALATSILVAGQAGGQGVGVLAGGLAFDALARTPGLPFSPWRLLYLAGAIAGVLLCALVLTLREPARHERGALAPDWRVAALELWGMRGFFAPLIAGLLFAQVTIQAASVWASPILIRRGLTPGAFAPWLGPLLMGGGIAGTLVAGTLVEAARRRLGAAGTVAPAALVALVMAPASLFVLAAPLPLFAALLAADTVAGAIVATVVVIAITLHIPNAVRGLALGSSTFAAAVFGAAGAPAVVALISRALGGEARLGTAFALLCVPAALLSALFLGLSARHAPPRDDRQIP